MEKSITRTSERQLKQGRGCFIAFGLIFVAAGLIGGLVATPQNPNERLIMYLVCGVFVVAGLLVATVGWRQSYQNAQAAGSFAPRALPRQVVLASDMKSQVIGMLIFAIFWNAVVGVFWGAILAERKAFHIVPVIFISIFTLIGLLLLAMAVRRIMQAAIARPEISLSSAEVPLGRDVELKWVYHRSSHLVESMKLTLIGREEAQYRRGTDTVTDHSIFLRTVVVDVKGWGSVATGRATIRIPADSMHTFTASNNKIQWHLELEQVVKNWPDVKCNYPIKVTPVEVIHG